MTSEQSPQSKGGEARAKALTTEEKSAIARKAAEARWSGDIPQAGHDGVVTINGKRIYAAVLPNGKRLLSQGQFLKSLGRARSPKAGTGALTTVDGLPFFLQADQLKPFISEELRLSTTPIFFKDTVGRKQVGYDAELLPQVCEVYLRFRDECLTTSGKVPAQYDHIVKACDILMRGLAQIGIIALVDEATGYQDVRDRQALQAILDRFLAKELAAWAKRFPDEFYQQIFRLRNWQWRGMQVNRPQVVAKYTTDLIYDRLAPGIVAELESRNPKDDRGKRRAKHHQWLTEDVGHPALAQQLFAAIGFMRAANSWNEFLLAYYKAFPKKGLSPELPF